MAFTATAALFLASCTDESAGEDGLGGARGGVSISFTDEEAEAICASWCVDDAGCKWPRDWAPRFCMDDCLYEHRAHCGDYYTARRECELGLECHDEDFECSIWDRRREDCNRVGVARAVCERVAVCDAYAGVQCVDRFLGECAQYWVGYYYCVIAYPDCDAAWVDCDEADALGCEAAPP